MTWWTRCVVSYLLIYYTNPYRDVQGPHRRRITSHRIIASERTWMEEGGQDERGERHWKDGQRLVSGGTRLPATLFFQPHMPDDVASN